MKKQLVIGLMCSGVYAVAKNAVLGPLSAAFAIVSLGLIINPVLVRLEAGLLGGSDVLDRTALTRIATRPEQSDG